MPGTRATALLAACGLALAAAGLPGCGGDEPTDQEAVRSKLLELADATRAKRYDRLCDRVFDPQLIIEVEQAGIPCEAGMERLLEDVADPRITIGRITIDGDRASAEVRTSAAGQPPSRDVVELVRRDDGWRVSELAGSAGPG